MTETQSNLIQLGQTQSNLPSDEMGGRPASGGLRCPAALICCPAPSAFDEEAGPVKEPLI